MLSGIEAELGKTALKKTYQCNQDVQKTNADINKAQNLINYLPKTNYQNGIKICEWF